MTLRILTLGAFLLLIGCASPTLPPEPPASAPLAVVPSDPQLCGERAECTTKVSRTLLFVFDYAAAGGHLLQRQGRLLFTPDEAVANEWPAIAIRLAEPVDNRFEFAAECQVAQCRYSADELLRVYRSYLADRPCSLQLASSVRGCPP
ncbi:MULTISPECIES: hypothetical protein [unclassified Pseudomonas]|uniref:hypothetical protein n=1 Tax=unclassified Pseudomonas TaxID=196821 RepID=UPI002447CC0D|nr:MULTISPECIES: hypothetical protein [unclassified Pseudomonas]MDG9923153.1 hypothetical protein [Pseudomonas sp. GD04045]MDH0034770.1 hypothetical protein [Pseudomonas sp. GD04019]